MARSAENPTIEDALAALKRDPTHPVRVHVQDMDVELRMVSSFSVPMAADVMNGVRWEGESAEELLAIIKAGRALDESGPDA